MSHQSSVSQSRRSDPDLRSTRNTARILDCSTRTIYRLVAAGEISPVRVGRSLRFDIEEIRRYLERGGAG